MSTRSFTAAVALLLPPMVAAPADGAIQVIYTTLVTDPSSVVPLGPQLATAARFIGFRRPFASPDGTRWLLLANTNLATSDDEVLVVFNGTSAATVLREGQATPWAAAENSNVFRRTLAINNAGQFAVGVNTSGSAAADECMIKWDGVAYSVIAREGQAAPVASETWGGTLDSANIQSNGTVGFCGIDTVGLLPNTQDGFCMRGATILQQEGLVPPGQAGALAWETFSTQDLKISSDGVHYLIKGDLTTSLNDDILVVDGTVRLQEGVIVPASGFTMPISAGSGNIADPQMTSNGDWFCRGQNVGSQDWVVRNGVVIAATDQSITPAATETWDDTSAPGTFIVNTGNAAGDWIVGGFTSHAVGIENSVLVFNGTRVVARENDPVDVDGNGLNDDNAFIHAFHFDDVFLTNGRLLYFVADLRNSATTLIGQALLKINLNVCPADTDGNNVVNVSDLLAVINTWGACPGCPPAHCPADVAPPGPPQGDCQVNVTDLLSIINAWGPCP